ncbi:DUF2889 domain-containing protein [Paraburkholderia xenovorans]
MGGRQLIHIRQFELLAFMRDDGLWDLQVSLSDRKTREFRGGARDHSAGTPIHCLALMVTVDPHGLIVTAAASMKAVPFEGSCQAAAPAYDALVGLNLFDSFHARLKDRIALRQGCSHLSEMAKMLPTLAIQSFAGQVHPVRDDGSLTRRPPHLDRCRGLSVDGEAVRQFFPRWYRKSID